MVDELEVSYHEGWDPGARAAVGALSPEVARGRDHAGEQYAVLLSSAGRPVAVIEIAWGAHYCATWLLDEEGRRDFVAEGRVLAEGRLFIKRLRQWVYADAGRPEFDDVAERRTWVVRLDGQLWLQHEPSGSRGGRTDTGREVSPDDYWMDVPEFGDWGALAGFLAIRGELSGEVVLREVPGVEGEGLPPEERPWHPPRPLRPGRIDLLFTEGTRHRLTTGEEVTVEVWRAGAGRFSSGKVAAADPGWLDSDVAPFTTAVSPGEYDLVLSRLRLDDPPEAAIVAAARLEISEQPVASWELALRDGQDPRTLGEGEFFGFGVDAGLGCFVDAAALPSLAEIVEEAWEETFSGDETGPAHEFTDPGTGANLIAFRSGFGDGSYPTWIGRDERGGVACFVADMLVVDEPL
ncbi:DUF4241 domain-containing protein [Actinomadura rugatobispora]|uniref:DUF4241 domain-containing protein n=1 Tax=Actinomadura rugatobispora TaxID=1994 RepID=A0ABW0ZRP0_9ACTN|nr:DUF4241 domain-containing protein [Actinomadura rugatobispora]